MDFVLWCSLMLYILSLSRLFREFASFYVFSSSKSYCALCEWEKKSGPGGDIHLSSFPAKQSPWEPFVQKIKLTSPKKSNKNKTRHIPPPKKKKTPKPLAPNGPFAKALLPWRSYSCDRTLTTLGFADAASVTPVTCFRRRGGCWGGRSGEWSLVFLVLLKVIFVIFWP